MIVFAFSLCVSILLPIDQTRAAGLQSFYWRQGSPAVVMMKVNDGFCYLTMVTGNFRGDSESVMIRNSNNWWVLSGSSKQKDLAAGAACVTYKSISNTSRGVNYATQVTTLDVRTSKGRPNISAKDLAPVNNSTCYLTGMAGEFNGGGEKVSIYQLSNWSFQVTTSASYIRGEAHCFTLSAPGSLKTARSGLYQWQQGQNPVTMFRVDEGFCYLTQIQGKFKGAGEAVGVYNSYGQWTLGGNSAQQGVAATAMCLKYNF